MAQNSEAVSKLVQGLEEACIRVTGERKEGEEKPAICKKTTYPVPGTTDTTVDSWKFNDWDYHKPNLPTHARGLFTTKRKDDTFEIAVRGYDKFFNVNETPATKWDNILRNTRGPYEVGVKENGCIIFISGTEDGTLMVCSKHSIGPRPDGLSHALAGESWVTKHVTSVGKSTKELAKALREMNATAVGELCDDSFEEHVLAYSPAAAGIYLHGLNYNVPQFATMSGEKVQQFADEWGFRRCKFESYPDVDTVSKFLEECSKTGTWDGRETEGFVVRCQLKENGVYNDWFFKYKFEEPYLMYRQWRECTKAVIAGRTPKIKKQVQITELYLDFARKRFAQDPKLADLFMHGHGIISLRTEFLEERGLRGWDITAMNPEKQGPVTKGLVLAPIATLGCGKTTVAMALTSLFIEWGHLQNDNLPQQKNKPKKFAAQISQALGDHKVVIADRNNHQRRERAQLMHDVLQTTGYAKFVALNYVHDYRNMAAIKEVTRKRVLARGDNHQSIKASSKANGETLKIMDGFLQRFESIDTDREPDDGFDLVINLDICASSIQNLSTIVAALHNTYPLIVPSIPSREQMVLAIEQSIGYKVKVDLSSSYHSNKPKTPSKRVELFQIGVGSHQVNELLQSIFSNPTMTSEEAWLYNKLVEVQRIQPHFHVTLIHRTAQKSQAPIWDFYSNKFSEVQAEGIKQTIYSLGTPRICIERLVWDHRVMAFVVRILPPKTEGEVEEGKEEDLEGLKCASAIPHITVGTADQGIKPKESNDLLARWLEFGSGGDTGIFEHRVSGKFCFGHVCAVMMR